MAALTTAQIMQQQQAEAEAAQRAEEERKEAERASIRSAAKDLADDISASVDELNDIAAGIRAAYLGIWSSQAASRMEAMTGKIQQVITGLRNI